MNKLEHKEGFTLVELLIVMAIIGILAGISIPVFTSLLEKTREATDLENVRSAYTKVRNAAILGEARDSEVTVDNKGTYTILVSLVQKQDDWQTASEKLNIGGIDKSDGQHWRGIPTAGGSCKVTCSAEGETIIYWSGVSGYIPAQVSNSAEPYARAINAVLSTIYNSIVADRLDSDTNHISFILIKNGKVSEVSCYKDKADAEKTGAKGQGKSGLTAEDMTALDEQIRKAMIGTGYKLSDNSTEYIFFDWEGNAYSNAKADGSGPNGVGGRGAYMSLGLASESSSGSKKTVGLSNKTGEWTK